MYSMRDWPRPRRSSLWAEVTYETAEYRNLPEFWAEMGKAIGTDCFYVRYSSLRVFDIVYTPHVACLHLFYDSRNLLYWIVLLLLSHVV